MDTGKVVIAGGSGLIGRALAAELGAAGREIVVLSRGRAEGLPGGARAVRWDGRTADGWAGELEGASAVVNLAGEGIADRRWSAARKRALLDSRLGATAAVVAGLAAARRRPPVLAHASAVGYYGDRGDEWLDEDSPPGSGFLAELADGWERASAAADTLGVRRVLLRTGLVLAREGGALAAIARPFRFGVGGPLGDGRQWMPWIHVADQVGAIRFLIETAGTVGPFNLVAPAPETNAAFSRGLARALGRPCLLRAPGAALRLALGEMADMLLGGQRLRPRRLLDAGYRFRFPTLADALADLLA
jgi:uncharacterized protein (TIGR01777 family)